MGNGKWEIELVAARNYNAVATLFISHCNCSVNPYKLEFVVLINYPL